MSYECGECEGGVYRGHAGDCSLAPKEPQCESKCPCGNQCVDVQDERHTEEHTQALYQHSLEHYCRDCSEV